MYIAFVRLFCPTICRFVATLSRFLRTLLRVFSSRSINMSVVLLVTLVLTMCWCMDLYVCSKCEDICFCHFSYKHKAITTTTTTTTTTTDSHEFELLNIVRRRQRRSVRIALPTCLHAFHCCVVLVQEAWCEVGDDWMVAWHVVDDDLSERFPFRQTQCDTGPNITFVY